MKSSILFPRIASKRNTPPNAMSFGLISTDVNGDSCLFELKISFDGIVRGPTFILIRNDTLNDNQRHPFRQVPNHTNGDGHNMLMQRVFL